MMYTASRKSKKFLFVLIKLSIVVAAFYFIHQKLTTHSKLNFYDFIDFLTENHVFSLKHLISLFILTIFNWFFEIIKWQKLIDSIKKISFKKAMEQSLGALTASLFTPNRIGEYGAKAAFYSKGNRKHVMLINLISNMMQMTVTCIFGVIGLYYFINRYPLEVNFNKIVIILTTVVSMVILLGFIIKKRPFSIKGFPIKKIMDFIVSFHRKSIFMGFGFSLARYLIFSFQFYYLLHIFGVPISYLNAMGIITTMYFLASITPSIFIFDVVIKGSVAVYLFSHININELTVLAIITLMWIFNFVLPSIFGSYYVLRFKLPKTPVEV